MLQVKCPEIVLVSGEDLSPYRQASRAVLAVLARFGTVGSITCSIPFPCISIVLVFVGQMMGMRSLSAGCLLSKASTTGSSAAGVRHLQVEKGGMDEAFVDVTKEAKLRVAHGACPASWHGHLHLGEVSTAAGSKRASVRCSASLEGGL